jgi:signal transduction histidine kinase
VSTLTATPEVEPVPFTDRLSGRNAITVWSWFATLPFALTVMSGYQYITSGQASGPSFVLAVALAAIVHGSIGVLLIAGAVLLHFVTGRTTRMVVALAVFAAIGVLRLLLWFAWAHLLGIETSTGNLGARIAVNVVVCVLTFSLIAIAVDLTRDHRGVFRRLREAKAAVDATTAGSRFRIDSARRSWSDNVLSRIDEAVTVAHSAELDAIAASDLLRRIADEIVRPASHALFEDKAEDGPAVVMDNGLRSSEWLRAVARGMRPAPIVVTAVLFAALASPYVVGACGLTVGLSYGLFGSGLLVLGNAAVAAISRRSRSHLRPTVLACGYLAVSLVLFFVSTAAIGALGYVTAVGWIQIPMYPIIALTAAFIVSVAEQLWRNEIELSSALRRSVDVAARAHAELDLERRRMAHTLHSSVQADLIATSLSLRIGARDQHASGDTVAAAPVPDTGTVIDETVARIRRELDERQPSPSDPRRVIESLLHSWEAALPLNARINDRVWPAFRDPVRFGKAVDSLSEGLANAVRHGDGSEVTVTIDPFAEGGSGILLTVRSGGRITRGPRGIGLSQLSEGATVTLEPFRGGVQLTVAIP